jgi:hypothetical protein
MKRLIFNMLIIAFFLIGLCAIGVNTSMASRLSDNQLIALDDDPNEPEIILGSIPMTYLGDEPNEPRPEIVPYDLELVYLGDDPNEPEPE